MLNVNPAIRTLVLGILLQLFSGCVTSVQSSNFPPQTKSSPSNMNQKTPLIEIAQNLQRYEILTEQDYQAVTDQINQGKVTDRAGLLELIRQQIDRRESPNPDQRRITDYVLVGKPSDWESYFQKLRLIAEQLKQSGAISDRVYRKLQRRIGEDIQLDLQLFDNAARLMRGDEKLELPQIQPFLDDLQRLELITSSNLTKLRRDLETGVIEDKEDVYRYLENIKIFNLQDYSRDPNVYFPQIHREVAQLLTKAGAAKLDTATFQLKFIDDDENNTLISTRVNGRNYEFASYSSQGDFSGMIDNEEFVWLFNKILRDQGSSYRVYTLGFFGNVGPDYSRFAVLILTEKQAKQLQRWVYSYLSIGLEDHSSAFNSDRIESILSLMEEIGLLSHLTPQQKAAGRQKISRQYINSSYEVFAAFDDLLISFDWETGNLENPYQALTRRFAAASRGAFQPMQISDEFDYDKQIAGQSFVLRGVRYSIKLKFDGDWLDPKFINFLDRAITQTVSDGKFYPIYAESSEVGYLFLSDRQRQILESEKLIKLKPDR
ncbi:hypothetical protein ACQ4M3_39115 [Leptolyngbya sp. AN03gr2]|uniref:hypothetical protein n=1 Tax=unclassified Leptolyngbya TaxID=2650499 RepID=UPI003D31253F